MKSNLRYHDGTGNDWHYCLDYVEEPLAVLYDGDVINVDDFVHVICGKVICWNREDLSLDDVFIPELIDFARNTLYVKDYINSGHGNVMFLVPITKSVWPGSRFARTDHDIDELPDVLRHNIKLCCKHYEEHGL